MIKVRIYLDVEVSDSEIKLEVEDRHLLFEQIDESTKEDCAIAIVKDRLQYENFTVNDLNANFEIIS